MGVSTKVFIYMLWFFISRGWRLMLKIWPIKTSRFQTPEVNKHRLPQRVTLTEGNFTVREHRISNACLIFCKEILIFDNMFNITTLLQAAEYLERRERGIFIILMRFLADFNRLLTNFADNGTLGYRQIFVYFAF